MKPMITKRGTTQSDTDASARGFRPRRSMVALESRVVFDGAMAAGGADPAHATADALLSARTHGVAGPRVTEGREVMVQARGAGKDASPDRALWLPSVHENAATHNILFVDSRLPDYQQVVAAAGAGVKVVVLDKNLDGIKQIADVLKNYTNLDSISIASHGDDGVLLLGTGVLHNGDLANYQSELHQIGAALKPDGEILLFGCNVGAGTVGRSFIDGLALATGAVIGASTDNTGIASRGGNWDLEISTGTLSTTPIFDTQKIADWNHLAATDSVATLAQLKAAIAADIINGVDDTITLTADITFSSASDTITINDTSGKAITIVGGSHTVSGANLAQVLHVTAGNVTVQNLTISSGFVTGAGGSDSTANSGKGEAGGDALGAGIYNAGTLTISGSTITGNRAAGGGGAGGQISGYGGGGGGGGGAGSTHGGAGGTSHGNAAGATSAGTGGTGAGGSRGGVGGSTTGGAGGKYGAYSSGGTAGTANNGTIAIGGGGGGSGYDAAGGNGGNAVGAIYNTSTGTLTITTSTISNNIGAGGGGGGGSTQAAAGNGGDGGFGVGGILNSGGTVQVDASTYSSFGSTNKGAGGSGGTATGGSNNDGTTGAGTNKISTINGGATSTNYTPPDTTAPTVSSIARVDTATSNATSVKYTVKFDESVTGVGTSDFALTTTGSAAGSISAISGSGDTYTITVSSVTGDGTVRLDLNSSGTGIADSASNAIATGFMGGEVYTFDHTVPAIGTPDLAAGSDSGDSATDNYTNDTTPTFSGTAEIGASVTLYDTDGSTVLATVTADGSGNWSATTGVISAEPHTITAKATDAVGNVSAASSSLSMTIDTTAATVSKVSSSTANGTYKVGDVIAVTVAFNETVYVTGTPQITLETGTTDRTINYSSGSGSDTLTFNYTVQAGDTAADLDYVSTSALALNSGTITDTAGNNATLTLATPGASGSLGANKDIVVAIVPPSITSATYNATTDTLTVTAADMTTGDTIVVSKLTLTGDNGETYKLTSGNVTASSATEFSVTLNGADAIAVEGLLNKTGTTSADSTAYNLSADSGWDSSAVSSPTDSSNAVDVTAVSAPAIASATYNANTGTLVVTGSNFVGKAGATNDVTVGNLTLLGDGGKSYTLTSGDVEVDSATQFTVTLNAADKRSINGLLNKTGTQSVDATTYNIAAASAWNTALAVADLTSNGVTASNIQTPEIDSATYNTVTGVLAVTGKNLVAIKGSANDIAVNTLTFKGLGGSLYSLSSGDVDITDATSFSVTLNSTDQAGLAALLDKAGTKSSDNVTYNLEASDDWNSTIADADISDTTNGVTVSIPAPSISKVVQTSGNGYYKAGDTVTLQVYFDQSVTVDTGGGTPSLLLETGSTDQSATYTTGSGSKILTFSYTVQAGDTSNDLQYFDTSALGLGGATIKATLDSAVDATLTLPATNSGNSLAELSAVIIDTTAPGTSTPDMVAGSDSGTSSADDITNDTTPTFEGTTEANATVTLYHSDGATQIGTTTADGSGNWSITSSALTDGSYTVKTRVTDAAGNESSLSTGVAITIDTTAPTAPTSLDLPAAFDSGYFNNDNVTNKTSISLNLSAEKNSTVTVYDTNGSTVLATGTTNGSGSAQVTNIALSEMAHSLTVKATDAAGNTSSASSTFKVTVDTTAPTGTPATPVLASSSDTGSSNSDGVTKNDSPAISGSGLEADGYVEVYDGASQISTAKVDGSGNWSDTLSGLSEGSHSITVKEYDLAGNLNSTTSGVLTIEVDVTAPTTPNAPDLASGSDSGSSSTDDVTAITTPTFTGTADANATVTLYHSDGATQIGTTTADGSGKWSITSSTLSDGAYTLKVTATDAAGNVSALSTGLAVTIDTKAPAVPAALDLASGSDSGSSSTDDITNDDTPTVSGTADANAIITMYDTDNTTVLGTTTADGSGNWSITSSALSGGTTHVLTAKATDAAGNVSAASTSLSVTVDLTAPTQPDAPDLDSASDSGSSSTDNETSDTTPTLSGSTDANVTVTLYDSDGTTALGTTTSDGSGKWSITSSALSAGATHVLTVKTTDLAGNVSSASSSLSVKVDTTAPSAPGTPVLDSASDTGTANNDQNTSDDTPTITGTADANVTITLYDSDGTTVLGTTTSDGSGNWSITSSTLSETTHTLTVKASDTAGNVSTVSSGLAVAIDKTAPTTSIATLKFSNDTGSSSTDFITKTAAQTISGTLSANLAADETVQVSLDNGSTWKDATATVGQTNWSLSGETLSGSDTLKVRLIDTAGNTGTVASQAYVLDQSAPSASTIILSSASDTGSSSSDGKTTATTPVITGVSEANAIITLYDTDGTTVLGTTTADGSGKWSITSDTLAEASHTLTVKATDEAGNVGTVSSDLTVVVDLTAPSANAPDLDSGSDSGRSNSDDITASTTPTFSGKAELGSTVTLYDSKAGSLGSIATDGSGNWTITSSKLTEGSHDISIKVTDAAGNVSAASSALTVEVDTTVPNAPTIKLDSASDSGTDNTDGITNVNMPTFSGTTEGYAIINLFDTNNKTVLATTTADSLGNWSVTVTQDPGTSLPLAGTHTVTAVATDKAGNVSSKSSGLNMNVDTTAPALFSKITISDTAFKIGDTATVTFVFTEAVSGFTTADVTVENGKLSSLSTKDNITWTAVLTPTTGVTKTANMLMLDNTGYTDVAGNAGVGTSNSGNYSVDTERPTVSGNITVSDTALKIGDTATVTIVFSEAVTGFNAADLSVANGTLTNLVTGDGGITWTATLTPDGAVESASNVITVDMTGLTDLNGNSGSGSVDSVNYAIDTKAPTLAITSNVATLKAGETATITFTFSEDPGGTFAWDGSTGDVVVSNGTLSAISGSGLTRTATFTPATNTNSGTASITVDSTLYTDAAGNGGGAGTTPSLTFDTLVPNVSSVSVPANASYGIGQNLDFTVHFNENVTVDTMGGTPSIALTLDTGGTVQASYVSGSGSSDLLFRYTVVSTNLDTDGVSLGSTIVANGATLKDAAGNSATLALNSVASTAAVLVDGVVPAIASINRASSNNTNASTVDYTVTFTENVSGVDAADFAVSKVAGTAAGSISKVTAIDGKTYTVTLGSLSGTGDLRLDLNGSGTGIVDATSNAIAAGYSAGQTYSVDYDAPTSSSITISDTALKIGDTATVTFKFNEAISGFDIGDVKVANGVLSNLSTTDNITWTATLTPNAATTAASNVLTLDNTGYTDLVGNAGNGSADSGNYAIDTVRPSLASSITISDTAFKIGDTATVTFTFSEAVQGFAIDDVTVENGVLSNLSSGDGGVTWTATLTPNDTTTDSANILTLDYTGVSDLAGNAGSGNATSGNYKVDTVRPSLASSITISDTALKIGDSATVTFTFAEAVQNFTTADILVPNGGLSNLMSGDGGITWTATLTPDAATTDATNILTLDNTGVQDLAGNAGSGNATSGNYAVDTTRPTATIVVTDNDLRAGETSLVTITFSEAVANFDNADLTIANGTLSNVSSGDGGITWTATFTPATEVTDATNLITLANTGVNDLAGNSGSGSTDSNNYAVSTVRPTAVITMAGSSLNVGGTTLVTITFSQAVTGLDLADFTVDRGALSNLASGDGGTTWTATLTANPNIEASSNKIALNNTGYQNAATNTGLGTTNSPNYQIDTLAPTLSISSSASNLGSGQTATITFTLSEASTSFNASNVQVSGGTLSNFSGSGTLYTATFTPDADSTKAASISVGGSVFTDLAGNINPAGSTINLDIDTVAPLVTISSSDSKLRIGETATLTFTLSEAATDFTASDIRLSSGTLSNFKGSGTSYSADFTPATNSAGDIIISIDKGSFNDAQSNPNTLSSSLTLSSDLIAPTITISSDKAGLGSNESATLSFTLSESSSNFSAADVTVSGGVLSNFSGSGTKYTATFTASAGQTSDAQIAVAAGSFTDAFENNNLAATSLNIQLDTVPPVASSVPDLASASDSGRSNSDNITNVNRPQFTGTAEANSLVTVLDGNTVLGTTNADGNGNWRFTPATALADGVHQISARVSDSAGNVGPLSGSLSISIDTIAPNAPAAPLLPDGGTTSTSTNLVLGGNNAESGTLITLSGDGVVLGTESVNPAGNWIISGIKSSAGSHLFTATATDVAGNVSAPSASTTITVTPPTPRNDPPTPPTPPVKVVVTPPATDVATPPISTAAGITTVNLSNTNTPVSDTVNSSSNTPVSNSTPPADPVAPAQVVNNTAAPVTAPVTSRSDTGTSTTTASVVGSSTQGVSRSDNVTSIVTNRTPPDTSFAPGQSLSLVIPKDTFIAANGGQVTVKAVMVSGKTEQTLPAWLKFDPVTGTFSGTPPEGAPEVLEIRIIATDSKGNEASATFKVNNIKPAGDGKDKPAEGKEAPKPQSKLPGHKVLAALGLFGHKPLPQEERVFQNEIAADDGDFDFTGNASLDAANEVLGALGLSGQLQQHATRFSNNGYATLQQLMMVQQSHELTQNPTQNPTQLPAQDVETIND